MGHVDPSYIHSRFFHRSELLVACGRRPYSTDYFRAPDHSSPITYLWINYAPRSRSHQVCLSNLAWKPKLAPIRTALKISLVPSRTWDQPNKLLPCPIAKWHEELVVGARLLWQASLSISV